MLSFHASTNISATADHIWALLLDTSQWSSWDTSIERVEGKIEPGSKLTLHVNDVSRPFKLKVAELTAHQRLRLTGGMPLGLFRGQRVYELTTQPDATTTFSMTEQFSGPLAPLITKSIPDLQPSFDAFVSGLRAAAEA